MKKTKQTKTKPHLILGLGASGYSSLEFLSSQYPNLSLQICDTREHPPLEKQFKENYPNIPFHFGPLEEIDLSRFSTIVLSPGISQHDTHLVKFIQQGGEVIGDIELFARHASAPIVAITGTNGKSTVTTLVGAMAAAAGKRVAVGGNLGTPALDLLADKQAELFILELSSFQLETCFSFAPRVASILNISPDHLDRYNDFEDYARTKHRIYERCDKAVFNHDDSKTAPKSAVKSSVSFSLDPQEKRARFSLLNVDGRQHLACDQKPLIPVEALALRGRQNWQNALAALAIGEAAGLPIEPMLSVLKTFQGLPHRCQWVASINEVEWYNDSKGTNVGATSSAITGLAASSTGKMILIAGGRSKGADFDELKQAIAQAARAVVLIGEAAPLLSDLLKNTVSIICANDMTEAVNIAQEQALPGDFVLLSPACASFDMFENYIQRGDVFMQLVKGLQGETKSTTRDQS